MANVIFLHGASSNGKSTLARALQARAETPFWHVSIDHLRDSGVLPTARFRSGEFDWARARPRFFEGFHASLGAYADTGNDLILEHILDKPAWLDALRARLAAHDVFFVAVHCPLPLLVERERARGDRPMGSAAQDFATIHANKRYDLELDGTADALANADRLLEVWRSKARASSFHPPPSL